MKKSRFYTLLGMICLAAAFCFSASASILIPHPLILSENPQEKSDGSNLRQVSARLKQFTAMVSNGSSLPAGIYVEGVLAFKIVQQPEDNPLYVSDLPEVVTQFSDARQTGSLGLLAHNSLAGRAFFKLQTGEQIVVSDGIGRLWFYRIENIQRFQAVTPGSPNSSFIDPVTNARFSAAELFQKFYGTPNRLVLQTCIASQGLPSWGRYFVVAAPEDRQGP